VWEEATVVKFEVLYQNLLEGSVEKRRKTRVTLADMLNLQSMDTMRHAKTARRSLEYNAVLYLAMRLF
jgi:siroheme synthase (precorrin-2 oxidase/ferrochelatase)